MNTSKANSGIIIVFLFPLIFFGLFINGSEGQAKEPRGEISIVESWRPDINVLGHNVLQYLFEYSLNEPKLTPSLALSKEWIDDRTFEVNLRKGVFFHNGEPFDAYAVKFNFDFQRKHNPGRGVQVYLKNLKEIQIINSHTLRMVLSEPDALFFERVIVGGPIAGWAIGAPRYMEQVGWKEFKKRPLGTGPYLVEGDVKDYREAAEGEVYATLSANSNYWKKPGPRIGRIKFLQHSPKEALRALIEGQVDLVTTLIPKDTLKVAESPHSKVIKGRNDITFTSFQLNLMSPHTVPLRDMRVRKALNFAVNRQELIRYAFMGNATRMKGMLTKKCGVDLSDTESYEWNIPKARQLMKEAGYENGLKMNLFYDEKDYLTAQLLQRFYGLLNIELEIIPVKWEWHIRHQVYPNIREGYSWANETWWLSIHSTPSHVPEVMGGLFEWIYHSGAPWQTYPDWLATPLDEMYRQVARTKDRDKRFQIYKRANEYVADQALQVFTVAPTTLYGVNQYLEFVSHPSQYLYLDYFSVTDSHRSLRGKNN